MGSKRLAYEKRLLERFGTAQRPVAWGIFVGGWISLVAVLSNIISTGDAKWSAILGSVLVINDGFQAVQTVENELEEGGEADS